MDWRNIFLLYMHRTEVMCQRVCENQSCRNTYTELGDRQCKINKQTSSYPLMWCKMGPTKVPDDNPKQTIQRQASLKCPDTCKMRFSRKTKTFLGGLTRYKCTTWTQGPPLLKRFSWTSHLTFGASSIFSDIYWVHPFYRCKGGCNIKRSSHIKMNCCTCNWWSMNGSFWCFKPYSFPNAKATSPGNTTYIRFSQFGPPPPPTKKRKKQTRVTVHT